MIDIVLIVLVCPVRAPVKVFNGIKSIIYQIGEVSLFFMALTRYLSKNVWTFSPKPDHGGDSYATAFEPVV